MFRSVGNRTKKNEKIISCTTRYVNHIAQNGIVASGDPTIINAYTNEYGTTIDDTQEREKKHIAE